MIVASNDMDGGLRDEGPSIAQREKASTNGSLEQPETGAPNEVIEAPVPELSEPGDLGFEVAPLVATKAMAIVPSSSAFAAEATSVMETV
ncbi:hypothetical protein AMTR_s00073p00037790 [Amborella trichopoda]|uniref:Uncharacterized protein n=1 Tax=Amborella trichopoda TaxID=13333 RepID=W1NNG3_AMBTC|nr:hypothetical protein AMTR_s00073p00037790 [Amborella trichopoda]